VVRELRRSPSTHELTQTVSIDPCLPRLACSRSSTRRAAILRGYRRVCMSASLHCLIKTRSTSSTLYTKISNFFIQVRHKVGLQNRTSRKQQVPKVQSTARSKCTSQGNPKRRHFVSEVRRDGYARRFANWEVAPHFLSTFNALLSVMQVLESEDCHAKQILITAVARTNRRANIVPGNFCTVSWRTRFLCWVQPVVQSPG
jgi:hypothetical protein